MKQLYLRMAPVGLFCLPLTFLLLFGTGCPEKAPATEPQHEAAGEHDDHDEGGGRDEHDDHDEGGGRDEQDDHGSEDEPEEGVVVLTPEAAELAKIRVAIVEEQAVPFVLRTTARVAFDERRLAHVSPRIPGRVISVQAELGNNVTAGQRLVSLDSIGLGETKAEFLTARSEETLARKTREREERLFAEKITSEKAMMEATTSHENALTRLRSNREKLRLLGLSDAELSAVRYGDRAASHFALRAPIAGRIVEKHVVIGELVTPAEKVYTIADLSQLWIWIDVFERDLAKVHLDDTVEVVTEAHPGKIIEGRVAYIRDEVDPDTRVARARIDIPNPDGFLKPGMFAEVLLTDPHGAQSTRKSLAIVPAAVQRDGSRYIAFVKEGERRYERRVLRIGAKTERLVEVLEGLSAGEEVVVEGTFLLKSEAAKREMGGGHSH